MKKKSNSYSIGEKIDQSKRWIFLRFVQTLNFLEQTWMRESTECFVFAQSSNFYGFFCVHSEIRRIKTL